MSTSANASLTLPSAHSLTPRVATAAALLRAPQTALSSARRMGSTSSGSVAAGNTLASRASARLRSARMP